MNHKYITKIHQEDNKGWWLRVPEIKDGVIQPRNYQKYQKFFRKGKGTWKAALEEAIYYRDGYLNEHNAIHFLTTSNAKNNCKPRQNFKSNTSGVVGIALIHHIKPAGIYYSYKAYYSSDGVQKIRTFSIQLYGEIDAFKQACEIRYKNAGKLIITDRKAIPCLPEQEYTIQ